MSEPLSDEQRAQGFDRVSERGISVAHAALQKAETLMAEGKMREASLASATAKNASLAAGITTDKSLVLQGRPSTIVGTRDARELIADIRRELGVVDATVTELGKGV
jgi:hypothetical protein